MESSVIGKSKGKGSNGETQKDLATRIDELCLSDSDDEFPEIECELCKKAFSSLLMYEQHLSSKKHNQAILKAKLRQKLKNDTSLHPPKQEVGNKVVDSPPKEGDSIETLYCDICKKEVSGYIPYMAHMKGNIHARNLRQLKLKEQIKGMKEFLGDDSLDLESDEDGILQKPFAQCKPCQKTFYGPEAYQQHMSGVNHKKKMRHMKLIDGLKKDVDVENEIEDDDVFRKCEVCNKSFSGPVPYKMHLMSPVHEKELKRVEAEKELSEFFQKDPTGDHYICKECKKVFTDPFSLKSHLANNSHGKQKVKDVLFSFVSSNPEIVAVKSVQNVSSDEETDDKENFQNGHYFLVCKLCHMSFSGPESAKAHLNSKNHMKAKREKAEMKLFKEKIKEKSGGPSADRKGKEDSEVKTKMPTVNRDSEGKMKIPTANGDSKDNTKMPSANGNKTDSVSRASNEDFEFL